jgi:hypothetical protein
MGQNYTTVQISDEEYETAKQILEMGDLATQRDQGMATTIVTLVEDHMGNERTKV